MQKKIMLALIISSNGVILCQAPPAVPADPAAMSGAAALQPTAAAVQAPTTGIVEPPLVSAAPQQTAAQSVQPQPTTATTSAQPNASMQPITQATGPAQTTSPSTPPIAAAIAAQPVAAPAQASQPITMPEPAPEPQPEFQPAPEAEEEDIEIKGIDTVDINEAKGNWLYKRIWWEKAEHTYEKIKQLTDKILDSRMIFFVKRNELDRMIVEFYSELGFKQGELTELISFMTRQLDQERKAEGSLDEKERELLEILAQEKKNIEQLQQGTQNIAKVDRAIEDALMRLLEQLNQAKHYEQQAWANFKAINRELSDKKARELFYSMDTYWRNLNSINSYLTDAFAKYFDQLTQKIEQETDKIKTNVQALSEKGISLQAQALAMKQECKLPAKEEALPEEPEESTGFMGTIWGWVKAPFSLVSNVFGSMLGWVSGLLGGGESEEVTLVKPSRRAAKVAAETPEEPS